MQSSKSNTVKTVFEKQFSSISLPKVIRSDKSTPFARSNSALGLNAINVVDLKRNST